MKEQLRIRTRKFFWLVLLSLVVLAGCQSFTSQSHSWPSSDINELGKLISLSEHPQRVLWQRISLPEHQDADGSVPGPTDMLGVVAVLGYDEQALARVVTDANPISGQVRIPQKFVFDWFPQALRSKLVADKDDFVLQQAGYNASLFVKSSTPNAFFTQVQGTTDVFVYVLYKLDKG